MNKYVIYNTFIVFILCTGIMLFKIDVLNRYISSLIICVGLLLIFFVVYWRIRCINRIAYLIENGQRYQSIIDELEGGNRVDGNEVIIKAHFYDENNQITYRFQNKMKRSINISPEAYYEKTGLIEAWIEDIDRISKEEYVTVVVDRTDANKYVFLMYEILSPGLRLSWNSVFLMLIQYMTIGISILIYLVIE